MYLGWSFYAFDLRWKFFWNYSPPRLLLPMHWSKLFYLAASFLPPFWALRFPASIKIPLPKICEYVSSFINMVSEKMLCMCTYSVCASQSLTITLLVSAKVKGNLIKQENINFLINALFYTYWAGESKCKSTVDVCAFIAKLDLCTL